MDRRTARSRVPAKSTADITFTVTPAANAPVDQNAKVAARYTTAHASGYTDNVVRIVAAAEGRFQRWGNWQEYDQWLQNTAPQANRLGRSQAIQSMGIGQTIDLPVVVHNWSAQQQSGAVSLDLPADFTVDAPSKPYDLSPARTPP